MRVRINSISKCGTGDHIYIEVSSKLVEKTLVVERENFNEDSEPMLHGEFDNKIFNIVKYYVSENSGTMAELKNFLEGKVFRI